MAALQIVEATLLQAKQDYVCGNPGEEQFESARRWLWSSTQRSGGMLWTCELLGVEASDIRRQARREHDAVQSVRKR